ncbi:MAG: NupC/NupG family nucleoside CNT transporter [Thermodesulfobacteriota bacterium]
MYYYNFVSFAGLFIFLLLAWIISENRKNINYKTVLFGLAIMVGAAFFVFLFPLGPKIFLYLNKIFLELLKSSQAGTEFLFGPLALAPGMTGPSGVKSIGFILAIQVFPVIIFFSALMAVLYYYGIMQRVINTMANIFSRSMKVSGAESLVVASNIFVGIESAFTVRPYINKMTRSELCMILTAGMATVSSSVLGLYVFTLINEFPTIAAHLMSASVLSAPAAIVISKILVPESADPETMGINVAPYYEKESGVIEALIKGSEGGVRMIVGIAALLIAILGIVKLFDLFSVNLGSYINILFDIHFNWSLRSLLGYAFYPFTLLIGIPVEDAFKISKVIGERLVLTEVVSYQDLAALIKEGEITNHRTIVVTSYALCGFAHFASMAIFVGGISALAPKRTSDLAKLGFRALIAATLACFLTACIAGIFYTKNLYLLD